MNPKIAFGATSLLITSLLACSSSSITDEESREALTTSLAAAPCEPTHADGNLALECHRDVPGASGKACVYAHSKPRYYVVGDAPPFGGLGTLEDGLRHDVIRLGPSVGKPLYIIGNLHALNAQKSAFTIEESTFSVKAVKNLAQAWDSEDFLAGLVRDDYRLEQDPSVTSAATPESRAAALAAVTRKRRDQILAECIREGTDEKTCKESTLLFALWIAQKVRTETELREVADVDKTVKISAELACQKK
jgi:hypothetical protein